MLVKISRPGQWIDLLGRSSFLLLLIFLSLIFDSVHPEGKESIQHSLVEGWGLPDSVAVVGKLFQYQLPTRDATGGNYTNYKVTGVGEDGRLPSWLTFNEMTSSIEGVPSQDVSGQIHNIQVMADCISPSKPNVIHIKEYFTIKVTDEDTESAAGNNEDPTEYTTLRKLSTGSDEFKMVRCRSDASVTTASLIIDADENSLTATDRVSLVRNLCSHLRLPVRLIRLKPLKERPIFDDSALVAGPGDTKHQNHSGVVAQWNVGCGNVYAEHMPILELLEVTSGNGTMGKAIGHGILGWHITSKRRQPLLVRMKRQGYYGYPTATPIPSVVRPTGRPVPTMTVKDTDVPDTRVVPTTASGISPTMTRTTSPGVIPIWPTSKDTTKPTRLTKSPTPATSIMTMIPITPTYLTGIDFMFSTTPKWPVDGIEPSISTDRPGHFKSTDALPTWTTTSLMTDSVLPTVFPSVTSPATATRIPGSRTKKPPKTSTPPPTGPTSDTNMPPAVNYELDVIEAFEGKVFVFRIPDDLFTDDGGTENLNLMLLQSDDNTVEPTSWVQLNETSLTLYGHPLHDDVGMKYYKLVAIDRKGKVAKTPLTIAVNEGPEGNEISHEISVTLDGDHEKILYDMTTRVNLINKIANAFGDKDASKMTIRRISSGSIEIVWTNNSIPSDPCPDQEIEALSRYILRPDGTINETFARNMEPYRVLKADTKRLGVCAGPVTDEPVTTKTTKDDDVGVRQRVQPDDNLLLYILLPVLIIVFLVLLIIICVVCYKRERKRQKEQDKLTGLHKGIPIIFADELEDKQDTPTSTLKSRSPEDEEKQSVPPPEYPSSKPGSKSSTLRSDYKSPLLTDNEEEEGERSPALSTMPRKGRMQVQQQQEQEQATTTPLLHYDS